MIVPDETATAAPRDLRSLNDAEVGEVLVGWGHKSYRTRQLLDWVYKKRVCTFDEMTDLSQELRAQLPEAFRLQSLFMCNGISCPFVPSLASLLQLRSLPNPCGISCSSGRRRTAHGCAVH